MFGKKLLTLYRHNGLYLKHLMDKGRGVFCLQDIKADEILEISPLLLFSEADTHMLQKTVLKDYIFNANPLPEKFLRASGYENPAKTVALPMGICSICNHMADPNSTYSFELDDMSAFAVLKAKRDIPKGEEISVSYGDAWFAIRNFKK